MMCVSFIPSHCVTSSRGSFPSESLQGEYPTSDQVLSQIVSVSTGNDSQSWMAGGYLTKKLAIVSR